MRVNKPKCKVLQLGRRNPHHQYSQEDEWHWDQPCAEGRVGLLAGEKLDLSQQCTLTHQKVNLTWAASKEVWPASWVTWFCPSTVLWWEATWSTASRSAVLITVRDKDLLEWIRRRATTMLRARAPLPWRKAERIEVVQAGKVSKETLLWPFNA